MHLTMDFETRSEASLKKCGTWAYAEHPTTRPMCLAFKPDDLATRIWVAPEFLPLLDRVPDHGLPLATEGELLMAVATAETVEAHNSMFEYAMWHLPCRRLFGWPELPLDKMRCSAAKAAAFGYPRSLEQAARTARIGAEKDKTGYALMMKWCKPRKPTKDNPSIWADDPHEFVAICRYCIQDVEVEHKFSKAVPDLTPSELATWKLDQRMNAHGLRVDMPAVQSMLDAAAEHEQRMLQELRVLTGGRIDSVKKVKAMVEYINERLPDDQVEVPLDPDDADSELVIKDVPVVSKLTRDAVKQALGHPSVLADHIVKRVLEIRQSLSLSSVSKYLTLQMWANEDFIVRNLSRYYGAITGRWAGQGVQPHNLPRGKFKDVSACVQHLMAHGLDSMAMWWGDPMIAASTCIRAMLIPRKGKRYIDGDFKSVEAVTTAWLAGEEKVLNVFRSKLDLYRITAVEVFGGSYETVKSDERQIGKVVELACGFQGWVGAFQSMAAVYGVHVPDERAAEIILAWREARPAIANMWAMAEHAAMMAYANPGTVYRYRHVAYCYTQGALKCKLPSGRLLYYHWPRLVRREDKYKRIKTNLTYMTTKGGKWIRVPTYGGKLVENFVQATARDLLVSAMHRVDAHPAYTPVLSVHDELLSEVSPEDADLDEYCGLMSQLPAWAEGLPLESDGWIDDRFRKG